MLSSVVLPQPDGPVIATKEPAETDSSMSLRTWTGPRRPAAGYALRSIRDLEGYVQRRHRPARTSSGCRMPTSII